jgi:hypothetical protein
MSATLKIVSDSDPVSPRDNDNLGTMVCWHRRYRLGDEQPTQEPTEWFKENVPDGSVVLPLYLYDHNGITMRTAAFTCPWDSGQVGWIYIAPEKIKNEYSVKRISKKLRERVAGYLDQEVKTYDHFLTGQVWGFVYEQNGEQQDSCWGFLGDSLDETGLADSVPAEARPLLNDAWENRA